MFINFSNHNSLDWGEEQLAQAHQYGKITDYPFPNVSPRSSEEEISKLADKITADIISFYPQAVLCQGEFTLCYAVVKRLLNENITCLCATTQRNTVEVIKNGQTIKTSVFEFVSLREYT